MATGKLPRDGELRIGAVTLPAGQRVFDVGGGPVAWITSQPVTDTPRAWAMLTDAHDQTGLLPVLLMPAPGLCPEDELGGPCGVTGLDDLDAASVLAARWDGRMPSGDQEEEIGHWQAGLQVPFPRRFPGLAARQEQELSSAERGKAIGSLQAAYLGLVPAARPADILPLIGWLGSDRFDSALPMAAVLRSWEDRFGARLVEAGHDEIRLLVDKPPRTPGHARAIAAEHYAFADECGGRGLSTVPAIADNLIGSPFWTFWWD
jgi:hypothetical protein